MEPLVLAPRFPERLRLPCWETLVYFLGSLVDVILTYVLLYGDGPWVFAESNPVANYILERAGFSGMVVFKVILVAIVVYNCHLIEKHRPTVARRILRFAAAAVLAVVGYSSYLLLNFA